ncbi:MAG: hypothetical protein VKP70_09045 [Cyanobacteriota bacterium]|nr:hypothetical protein [Cyanobacteriota bacterium]
MSLFSFAYLPGPLPLQRGLVVRDPAVLERRELIRRVMCHGAVHLDLARFAEEWRQLQGLSVDGLVVLERQGDLGRMRVTPSRRWLIRSIAAVLDPQQQRQASGSRLI